MDIEQRNVAHATFNILKHLQSTSSAATPTPKSSDVEVATYIKGSLIEDILATDYTAEERTHILSQILDLAAYAWLVIYGEDNGLRVPKHPHIG